MTPTPATGEATIPEAEVGAFAESYTLFNEALAKLQASHKALEERFDTLNRELEATNLHLQQSLAEKERLSSRLEDILEGLGSGVLVVDAEGRITRFNQAAADILGCPEEKVVGRSCEEVLGEAASDLLRALASGESVRGGEKSITSAGGRMVPVCYNTSCLRNAAGEAVGGVESFDDISKLQELSGQASRVSTLTALGEMAATVAHEIRNPLGGIGGFAGLLERDLEVEDPRRRLVKRIIDGVAGLNRIVSDLLTYTRPVQLNLRPVDVVQVVEDAAAFFEIDAGVRMDSVEVRRAYSAPEIVCRVDPEQIQQIVLNLLHNALQAMPDGGELGIGLAELDAAEDARTQLASPCVVLTVRDSGVGMSEEVKAKLFRPFFTTKEDGNGLGLATARKAIEAHGGDIQVESEPDEGSTFTLFIPKSPG